jgi:hypothetical protein
LTVCSFFNFGLALCLQVFWLNDWGSAIATNQAKPGFVGTRHFSSPLVGMQDHVYNELDDFVSLVLSVVHKVKPDLVKWSRDDDEDTYRAKKVSLLRNSTLDNVCKSEQWLALLTKVRACLPNVT